MTRAGPRPLSWRRSCPWGTSPPQKAKESKKHEKLEKPEKEKKKKAKSEKADKLLKSEKQAKKDKAEKKSRPEKDKSKKKKAGPAEQDGYLKPTTRYFTPNPKKLVADLLGSFEGKRRLLVSDLLRGLARVGAERGLVCCFSEITLLDGGPWVNLCGVEKLGRCVREGQPGRPAGLQLLWVSMLQSFPHTLRAIGQATLDLNPGKQPVGPASSKPISTCLPLPPTLLLSSKG